MHQESKQKCELLLKWIQLKKRSSSFAWIRNTHTVLKCLAFSHEKRPSRQILLKQNFHCIKIFELFLHIRSNTMHVKEGIPVYTTDSLSTVFVAFVCFSFKCNILKGDRLMNTSLFSLTVKIDLARLCYQANQLIHCSKTLEKRPNNVFTRKDFVVVERRGKI